MLKKSELPKILLTGADPFEGYALNSSFEVVRALRGKQIGGHRIVVAELPTVFGTSVQNLRRLMVKHKPVLVICVGQASMRSSISLERVAINIMDARIPDNSGLQPIDEAILQDAPAGYFSTLPLKAILTALRKVNIKAEISETAGTFVCNAIFYNLMHELSIRKMFRHTCGGFIHVPLLPQQATPNTSSGMPLDQMVRALHLTIQTTLEHRKSEQGHRSK